MKLHTTCSLLAVALATGVSAQEPQRGLSCAGVTLTWRAESDRMRKLNERAKKEEKAPPADLLSAWQRTFGRKGDGIPALKELQRARKRADGLNETLRTNGCATIDIDRALDVS